ncbi:hypothetical protein CYMTET_42687 [Cymbomonas tetramitiformis]|uniref:CRAL-TRIO domain-containing protein n=1 Tax=Cymbomonas tetramitiformis TaxID=36881 RepID=A0AAE0C4R5_9CHLO|nr:hypothetical protein CYMTET_42687 [Cymbomonas tetramitiformis]|eukprot:gene27209-33495_t
MGASESTLTDLSTVKEGGETSSSMTSFFSKSSKIDWSAYEVDGEMDFELESPSGQERLEALKASVMEHMRLAYPTDKQYPELVNFICSCALRFRNGDMATAADRVQNYLDWRRRVIGSFEVQELSDENDNLLSVLNSNVLNIIEDVDSEGRCALVFRLRNLDPSKVPPLHILKAWHYLIMYALQSPSVQTHGIYVIGDMGEAAFSNVDTRITKALYNAISKNVPLRLHRVAIYRPFTLIYVMFPVVRIFFPAKLQKRIKIIGNDPQLLGKYLDMSKLPADLGGTDGAFDHNAKVALWQAAQARS